MSGRSGGALIQTGANFRRHAPALCRRVEGVINMARKTAALPLEWDSSLQPARAKRRLIRYQLSFHLGFPDSKTA
jgi:hypothetical protein